MSDVNPTKQCFKCLQVKPVEEFYRHAAMADGRLNKCKECTKNDVRTQYAKERPARAAYDRARLGTEKRKKQRRETQRRRRTKFPEKYRARYLVAYAVSSGKLTKLPCVYCGNPNSQAHHNDSSRPLEVVWACFRCHREVEHGQTTVLRP